MSAPKVSVIMPLYNTMQFVPEAVGSILSQTYDNFELIVVDNGSTDGSREYAMSLTDNRVRVITESVRGPGTATNAGIAASRAELLAIMDADDIAHPDRLRQQIDFMGAHPEVVLLGTRFAFRVGSSIVAVPPQPREHDQIRRALLAGQPVICNPSTMARTKAVRAVGCHHTPGPGADYDFFLRMSDVGKLHNLPELLHYYRLHGGSTSILRILDTKREHAFGLACALARASDVSEPCQNEFNQRWSERPALARVTEYADCKALTLYRKAILNWAQRQWLRSAAAITCAAMLSPHRTAWHVKRRLGLC
jgi:glycosyltransferase involved in cell wall biosynthesis